MADSVMLSEIRRPGGEQLVYFDRRSEPGDFRNLGGNHFMMTVEQCYKQLGGDYADIIRRMRTDERVIKFLGMLLRDDSFCQLKTALENEDYETAFRASHTLKGVLLNLSLTSQARVISELTEVLRARQANEQIWPLFDQAEMAYRQLTAVIEDLLGKKEQS